LSEGKRQMPRQITAAFALYTREADAEYAVAKLKLAGFRSSDVSILLSRAHHPKDFTHERSTKAPEGATTGVTTGAVLGGALGWLAGIGTLAIPGLGQLIAAGPIIAALAGAGLVGAVGAIAGGLIGMGIPEYEARRFEGLIKEGKLLLSIHCDNQDEADKARTILSNCGGEDVGWATEADAVPAPPPAQPMRSSDNPLS